MIPSRLLLRAATVLALSRGGDGPPFPTMAGASVFDTRLTAITDIAQETMLPVILVYTDSDTRVARDRNGARSTWERKVTLVIELCIGSLAGGEVKWAETDAELEAILDLFEAEVEVALSDPSNKWAQFWRQIVRSVDEWESTPFRSVEQTTRYAVRQLVLTCCMNPECLPTITTKPPALPKTKDANGNFIPGSLLPIPWLAEFEANNLASDPAFEPTRALLTGASQQIQMPELKRIHIKGDFIDPADPNRLPVGKKTGPDGRIEVEAHIEGLNE